MSQGARVVLGVPLHDNVVHVRPALESLLGQRADDFAVVVVDDSVSDGPGRIVSELGSPLEYRRNERPLGLVETWRRAFTLARELHPAAVYFAWGSDHDLWEPEWLAELSAALDEHREAVLAYPLNDRIDDGRAVREPWRFETAGDRSRTSRFARTIRRMVAGDMVYGLMRADVLERCGVYRRVVMPDRLLVAELALHGEFRQVPRILWHRRHVHRPGREALRQRSAHGTRPAWTRLPWSLQHAAALTWNTGIQGRGRPAVGRGAGLAAAAAYLALSPGFRAARWAYQRRPGRR